MGTLEQKTFIVTGASSGIGMATAELLAERGAKVMAMARTRDKLRALKKKVNQKTFEIFPGDVSRENDVRKCVHQTYKVFDTVDGVIHNAGITMRALAEESDLKVFRTLMEVNYFSMLYFYKYALVHLTASKGHLVGVSSMMGLYSTQYRSGYAASKHALQGFLDSVRLELADKQVHVMTCSPGFVNTDVAVNALGPDGKPHGKRDQANAEGLPPIEVAQAILDGIEHRKRDVIVAGLKERTALFLSRFSPATLDRILLKTEVT